MQSWKILEISWWKSKLPRLLVKDRPYREEIHGNVSIRKFYKDTNPDDLVWHRDREDRTVTVLEGKGWSFQYDDQLPIELKEGDQFLIERMTYHRLLKGTTELKVLIERH